MEGFFGPGSLAGSGFFMPPGAVAPASDSFLLLETGDKLLLETGDKLVLE